MRVKPDGLIWFTKPEIALKQRVRDHYRSEKEQERQRFLEHCEGLESELTGIFDTVQESILSSVEILNLQNDQNLDNVTPGGPSEPEEEEVAHTAKKRLIRNKSDPAIKKYYDTGFLRKRETTQMLFTCDLAGRDISEFPLRNALPKKLHNSLHS